MASRKDATGDVACKKTKGLKNHKRAQKEKALAKRTAAAEKTTANKASYAPVATIVIIKTEPMKGDVIGNAGPAPMVKDPAQVIVESSDLSRDESSSQEKAVTNIAALTGTHTITDTKTATLQPHLCTHLPVVVFEDVPTGSKNNTLTKVASNPTKLGQEPDSISYPKTAPPPKLITTQVSLLKTAPSPPKTNTTQTSMLNPTAPAFLFGKTIVAQTPPVEITPTKEDTAPGWLTENAKAFEKAYGVAALRKALEAALYENMETPRQRLIRCKYRVFVDAEFHREEPVHDLEWTPALIGKPVRKCFDDNGFVITPIKTGLTEADLTVPSALDELFTKVKAQGISKISAPISTGYKSPNPGAGSTKPPIPSRTLASVEHEMRLAKRPSHAPSFADPGIVKYTFAGQDFDNVGNPLTETVSQKVLGWLEDQPTDPPELSPGSSRQQSRETSPLEPGKGIAALTFCSKSESEGGRVWPAQESLPWGDGQDGYTHGSGVPVYPYVASVVRVSDDIPGSCGEPE